MNKITIFKLKPITTMKDEDVLWPIEFLSSEEAKQEKSNEKKQYSEEPLWPVEYDYTPDKTRRENGE